MCFNAIDRHVDEGKGEKTAVIWDSPVTKGGKRTLTFAQLREEVARLAGLMAKHGVKKGDVVMIYMPMIPETLMAMMAAVRLGATHSVVFGGFSANELAKRMQHLKPKMVMVASCGVEPKRVVEYKPNVEKGLELANAPADTPIIVYQRRGILEADLNSERDVHWQDSVAGCAPHDCVEVNSNHPLYIIHTSGTTGNPKGIVHPTGSHAVVNKWTMKTIYGMEPEDVWWAGSDFGWIVGHEYLCYSPLLHGNTTVIYEGKPIGTPDAGQYFRVMSDYKVNGFFTTPSAMRAIMSVDPNATFASKYDLSSLKYAFIAGEHCDPATMEWAIKHLKVPVLDNWWQTEVAHAITSTCIGLGNTLNPPTHSSGLPVPGFDVKIIKEDGTEAKRGELGRIACKLPLAPGTMITLFDAPQKFKDTYFSSYPGYYDTMDAGIMDEAGNVMVVCREDDVINVSGHRLSTSAIEEVVMYNMDVVDAAVVAVPDDVKGQIPLVLYITNNPEASEEDVSKALVKSVREKIGPVASALHVVRVVGLPKTRSGKIARKSLSDMASGKEVKIPPTIEDPTVYEKIHAVLVAKGFKVLPLH